MLRDAAQAYIEVLLEKGGSVPVDEGVETGNMPVVTVTVKTSSATRPLLTLTGVGGNVSGGLCYIRRSSRNSEAGSTLVTMRRKRWQGRRD